jgi:4-aminobutyrate aminotransferase
MSPSDDISIADLAMAVAPKIVVAPPGPKAQAVIERDGKVTSPSLPRAYPFVPRRGSGSVVEDVDGNLFLDMNAGIAVNSTGHSHPAVVAAIQKQAAELIHYSASDFFLPIYSEVCAKLDEISPMSGPTRVFLANSGTEAVEASIKLSRYVTGRQNIIAFHGSFHGRSFGSVSLTASKVLYRKKFGPLLPGVYHAPYGDGSGWGLDVSDPDGGLASIAYIRKILFKRVVDPSEVAAIIVEPVLGEGGYIVPPKEFFEELRAICDENGILLVADEVQSGMGRTGKTWAIQHFGVEPDVILSGKGIASGMPLGAMIAKADLMSWDTGAHGSTYGGSPTSCAAALATIDLIENGLKQNAEEVGGFLIEGLREIASRRPLIKAVRGLGLMIGIEFADHETMDAVEKASFKRGLLMLGCGDDAIRMSPPLLFRRDEAERALEVFDEACAEVG